MRNKRGFLDPHTLAIIAGVIVVILLLGWYNSSVKSKQEIEIEKLRNQDLQTQLYKTQSDLNGANEIIQNQTIQINKLVEELNQYRNSYGYFPLFWLTEIKITEVWAIILNISLFGFSLITIKFIFGGNKKRR